MMVGDDNVHSQFICQCNLLYISDAAVNGDEELRSGIAQLLNCFTVETKPFAVTVGNVILEVVVAEFLKEIVEHDGSRNPIGVVVAPNRNPLVILDCPQNPRSRLLHIFHQKRVVRMVFIMRVQKSLRLFRTRYPPPRQKLPQERRVGQKSFFYLTIRCRGELVFLHVCYCTMRS